LIHFFGAGLSSRENNEKERNGEKGESGFMGVELGRNGRKRTNRGQTRPCTSKAEPKDPERKFKNGGKPESIRNLRKKKPGKKAGEEMGRGEWVD